MLNENEAKEIIRNVVKKSFFDYFIDKAEPDTEHLLLAKLFPDEMRKSSVIQGLQTSLGTKLWEQIATKFADRAGFTVLTPKTALVRPNPVPEEIALIIDRFKSGRENPGANVPMSQLSDLIQVKLEDLTIPCTTVFEPLIKGSGADLVLQKDGQEYAFDVKTVQINAGSGTKFNATLISWIAYRAVYQKFSGVNNPLPLHAHIAIPYDPYMSSNWWTQMRGRAYPLDETDVMVGDAFWKFVANNADAGRWIREEFDSLVTDGLADTYRDFLSGSTVERSHNLIEDYFNVRRADRSEAATGFGKCVTWECNACRRRFKKSAVWFKQPRVCSGCGTSF